MKTKKEKSPKILGEVRMYGVDWIGRRSNSREAVAQTVRGTSDPDLESYYRARKQPRRVDRRWSPAESESEMSERDG